MCELLTSGLVGTSV